MVAHVTGYDDNRNIIAAPHDGESVKLRETMGYQWSVQMNVGEFWDDSLQIIDDFDWDRILGLLKRTAKIMYNIYGEDRPEEERLRFDAELLDSPFPEMDEIDEWPEMHSVSEMSPLWEDWWAD